MDHGAGRTAGRPAPATASHALGADDSSCRGVAPWGSVRRAGRIAGRVRLGVRRATIASTRSGSPSRVRFHGRLDHRALHASSRGRHEDDALGQLPSGRADCPWPCRPRALEARRADERARRGAFVPPRRPGRDSRGVGSCRVRGLRMVNGAARSRSRGTSPWGAREGARSRAAEPRPEDRGSVWLHRARSCTWCAG